MISLLVLVLATGVLCGILGRVLYDRKRSQAAIKSAEAQAARILDLAGRESEAKTKELVLEAKAEILRDRQEFDAAATRMRDELSEAGRRAQDEERLLQNLRRELEDGAKDLEVRRHDLGGRTQQLSRKEHELERLMLEERQRLEKLSHITQDEARRQLMKSIERDTRHECADMIKQLEDEAKELADRRAKQILSVAIQRWAHSHTAESTVSVVHIPSEDMKGRIIGREGRNIRALENATGVDLIIDDTPETVVVSSFNLFRREVARLSLEQLVADGRIHPSRIEEVVQKVRDDMEAQIIHIGEQACQQAGIYGMHPELMRLVGKLRFRTSYGQNQLIHTLEVTHLAATLAAEVGADVEVAKRAAFLHDIGKAVDQDKEGTHVQLGVEMMRRYNEHPAVIHCVEAHHNDVPMESIEAFLVQAADAISGSRPGARRESLEAYIKRLQKLEEIAHGFRGVTQAYALQAGREVRIMVAHDLVSDAEALQLARDVARKVEAEMEYPGQIKVQVIRETRAVEFAK
ncbi:MAG TPA: ribonuclease Y [bacterium]|jgi:ribonuclease Y|nr:ribonuclease Y [bacterium]